MIHRLLRDYLTISASLTDNEKRREELFNGCVGSLGPSLTPSAS